MTTIVRQPIHYAHARAGTAPATFGQRDVWAKLAWLRPVTHTQNILQVAAVPAGLSVAEVRDVLRVLILRHETLRTRFRPAPDGSLWQHVTASGELMCEHWEAAGEDVDLISARAERHLEHTEFDLVGELPARTLIGTLHGEPTVAMIVTSHIATDMLSARMIRQDLADLLAARGKGEPDPELPPRRQPLDQAAFEASLDRETVSRLLDTWRKRFTAMPPPGSRGPLRERESLRVTLATEATGLAADALAHRYDVTSAVVLMAAEAVLLAHHAGTDRAALHVAVGNRIDKELVWAAGNLRQHSLAVIDLRGADFALLIRRAWSAWMRAQRTGLSDPDAVNAVRAEVEAERGVALGRADSLGCGAYFNDLRVRTHSRVNPPTVEQILAATESSKFTWADDQAGHYAEFLMRVDAGAGGTRLSAFVDTTRFARPQIPGLLYGVERLLVWQATAGVAAGGPLTPARVAQITGIPEFEPPVGSVRVDGSWVDLAASADLLAIAAGSPSALRCRDGRLIGYVHGPGTPESLHERCAALLTDPRFDRRAVLTPQHYVVCAPGSQDWPDRPVLAQGSGRP